MDEDALEVQVGGLLRQRGLRVATAESCTGGLVGHRLTNVPGSSDYYLGGVVAYANEIKRRNLGVRAETLARAGAVSAETVAEMAQGARAALGADLAMAVSGIAGPGGGSPDKPVGLTWLGLSAPEGTWTRSALFEGDRCQNKALAAQAALQLLLDYLLGQLG